MGKVAVIPFYPAQMNNLFFSPEKMKLRDNILMPFMAIKEKFEKSGYVVGTADIVTVEDADVVIFFDLNLKYIIKSYFNNKLSKSIYISFEPPVVYQLHQPTLLKKMSRIFNKMLTWQDDLVDNQRIFKFFFPMPPQTHVSETVPFNQKKLLTTIIGYKISNQKNELYSKRIEAIRFFEKNDPSFEFFGAGWKQNEFKSYKGKINNKYDTLKNYKFALSYENEGQINGLVSEKIFDCFYARTIPVFWGAENVSDFFPPETFIDKREFKTYQDLHSFLINMSEEEYSRRLMTIEHYLKSENFRKHSVEYFAETVFSAAMNPAENPIKLHYVMIIALYKVKQKYINAIKRAKLALGRY